MLSRSSLLPIHQRHPHRLLAPLHVLPRFNRPQFTCRSTVSDAPSTAKSCVEAGLKSFQERKDYQEAIRLFNLSLTMNPNEEEITAALYNLGCAHAKLKQWKPASEAIVRAINDHRLKLSVALKDDDLKELRERREWVDALVEVKGGLSQEMKMDLRSEARSPFRFPRLYFFFGLGIGSAIGLVFLTSRLVLAVQGGEGAPPLTDAITNFSVNAIVLAVVSVLIARELKEKEKAMKVTEREELLSRLQINLGNGRVLPLLRFRGQIRPIIIAGSKVFIDKAMKEADKYLLGLQDRGVSLVPIILANKGGGQAEVDPDEKIRALKRELQKRDSTKGFGKDELKVEAEPQQEKPKEADASPISPADKKWKLAAYDEGEWQEWLEAQLANLKDLKPDQRNCYVQVQLDGTVRSSGIGSPNWKKLIDDIPPLQDIRTLATDGIGPS